MRIVLLFIIFVSSSIGSKHEKELLEKLLSNYSTLVRPVANPNDTLPVYIKVFLQQIISLDMKNQVMEMNAWIRYVSDEEFNNGKFSVIHLRRAVLFEGMSQRAEEKNDDKFTVWKDYQLTWNTTDYGNVSSIRVNGGEESQIWIPDILLWNSCDDEHFDSRFTVNAVVYPDGTVNYIPPGVFKITCKVDITWFPFDEQSCYMQFSSWTYHSQAIDLQLEDDVPSMDTSTFVKNNQWHLVATPAHREERIYSCCPEIYPIIRFWVHLRRRTLYYLFNVIIPSIIITLMTLVSFILPPHDMSEKIGHQTTIVLSVSFFLTVISEMTPPTSESVPLLGIFFSTVTCIVSSSAAFTITVLNLRYRQPSNHRFSKTFRRIFCEFLPWLMLMKRPGVRYAKGREKKDKPDEVICVKCTDDNASCLFLPDYEAQEPEPPKRNFLRKLSEVPSEQLSLDRKVGDGLFYSSEDRPKPIKVLQRERFVYRTYVDARKATDELNMIAFSMLEAYLAIHRKLEFMCDVMHERKVKQEMQEEWKMAAMAFDRFLLVVFTIELAVSIIGLAYSAPYFDAV